MLHQRWNTGLVMLGLGAAALLPMAAQAQNMSFHEGRRDMTINMMATRDQNYELNNRAATEGKLRPEVARFLQDAQGLLARGDTAAAADKIAKAEREQNKSPYELHLIARMKGKLALAKGDPDDAARHYLAAAQGDWLKPADRAAELELIASLYYHKKDYAKAANWFDRYAEAGGTNPNTGMLRAQSYYILDEYGNTAKVLDAELARTLAASAKPPELMLKLLVDAKERANDMDGSRKAQQLLALHYPGK